MLWTVNRSRPAGLGEQICGDLRRAIAERTLQPQERLPTAAELARVLGVNPNTVLAAYRALRNEGLLEFRRGRGIRVAEGVAARATVRAAAADFVAVGRSHGYSPDQLIALVLGTPGATQ